MSSNRFSSYGLLFGCPFQDEDRDCPLNKLRKLSIEDRMENIKNMSIKELKELEEHHKHCLNEREDLYKTKRP